MIGIAQTAEVHNFLDLLPCASLGKIPSGFAIQIFKICGRSHGVNEVVGRMDPRECLINRVGVQNIRSDDLCRFRDCILHGLGAPGHTTNWDTLLLEFRKQAAADVTGHTGQ